MRKLTELELIQIQNRLAALQIYFEELYNELYDHYVSELEKLTETEFQKTMARLNESFAWSIVRKMEQNIRKTSNQEVSKMQLDSLKFWKKDQFNWFLVIVMITLSAGSFMLFKLEGLFNCIAILCIVTAVYVWFRQGRGLSLNLDPKKQKPVKMLSAAIVGRLGSFFSFGSLLLFLLSLQDPSGNPGLFGLIIGFLISGLLLTGLYSLLIVSARIKTSKKLKI
jgi:hypothetical protein